MGETFRFIRELGRLCVYVYGVSDECKSGTV